MADFHDGELAVQTRLGVAKMAARISGMIHPMIFGNAAAFLAQLPFVFAASRDDGGRTWASMLSGAPGFLRVVSEDTLFIGALPHADDPLHANLRDGAAIGLLAIDFARRERMRLNGRLLHRSADGLTLEAREVYGNCPKYIQARFVDDAPLPAGTIEPQLTRHSATLTGSQQAWIAGADTFIIASAHPERDADASHRGGNPGFVRIDDEGRLTFPDYSGNMMFNTLGNIAVNPSVGLLFPDFKAGSTLQLTGDASIIWDGPRLADFPGAQRLVTVSVQEVIERQGALSLHFSAPDYSRYNPR
ncbi:MAG: pyridoxamine 5'-phosphate oxidase family protein [Pleurocapsa minor GSE-CHR-MK-17-07R]|jgi:predicted pyridoxine 5'-phosphate oxidase superfamily flavin-nucleotide-binding protein|nr:pyridoxamine 5'-phosphate oxidase family protein [Pleurocapsa minor GSE-CHR-MK 17-07R]